MAERFSDNDDLMHDVLDTAQGKENAPGHRSSDTEDMAALPDIKGPLKDNDLAELDRQAGENYKIKLSEVKQKVIYNPAWRQSITIRLAPSSPTFQRTSA